jgi:ABC-type phosphate transport system substrate-binding protein
MMRSLMIAAFALAVHVLGARDARAQSAFVVIVNPASTVTALSRTDVSKLFMRKITKWPNGHEVLPIDQVPSAPARRAFSNEIHRMDVPRVKSYWQALVFSGRGDPPPERPSDADIIQYVRSNPDAIGYVSASAPIADVKAIAIQK